MANRNKNNSFFLVISKLICIFAPVNSLLTMMPIEVGGVIEAGHYIMEKRHTMLCRLVI